MFRLTFKIGLLILIIQCPYLFKCFSKDFKQHTDDKKYIFLA